MRDRMGIVMLSKPVNRSRVRLLWVTEALMRDPSDARDLGQGARDVGASEHPFNRLFASQMGMSFRTWGQQRRLLRAQERLSVGDSVTHVTLELGYESTSAVIAMFRRCHGTTTARHLNLTS